MTVETGPGDSSPTMSRRRFLEIGATVEMAMFSVGVGFIFSGVADLIAQSRLESIDSQVELDGELQKSRRNMHNMSMDKVGAGALAVIWGLGAIFLSGGSSGQEANNPSDPLQLHPPNF